MDRACADNPSAPASETAAGPIAARLAASQPISVVRFMKSSTLRPDENRAVRAVGKT